MRRALFPVGEFGAELTRLIQDKLASVGVQLTATSVAVQELADVDMKSGLVQ